MPFIRKTQDDRRLVAFSEFACREVLFWTKYTEVRGRLGIPGISKFMLTGTSLAVSHVDLVVPRDLHLTRFSDVPSQLLTAEYAGRTSDAFRLPTFVMPVRPASVAMALCYSQPHSQLSSFMSCYINRMKPFLLKNLFLFSLNWALFLSCGEFFVLLPHLEGNLLWRLLKRI